MKTKRKEIEAISEKFQEFQDIVEQTYYLQQKVFEWSNIIDKNKEKMKKFLGRRSNIDVEIDSDVKFNVNKKANVSIEFFEDELAKRLDKDTYKRVSDKTIFIKNMNPMIKMLKKYGVDPKEFKEHISVANNVDREKLDSLIESGEIQVEELHGCYKAIITEEVSVKKIR